MTEGSNPVLQSPPPWQSAVGVGVGGCKGKARGHRLRPRLYAEARTGGGGRGACRVQKRPAPGALLCGFREGSAVPSAVN